MGQSRQSLEGRHDLLDVSEEVVGDVELYELFEGREVVGQILEAVAIERKTF